MRLPGFTAEAATYGRAVLFHMHVPDENRSSAGTVTPCQTCPPGSEMSGCPRGHHCAEPGDWPHCRCLECFGGGGSSGPWPWPPIR